MIEEIEAKHEDKNFIAGDLSDDFKEVVKALKKLRKEVKDIDQRLKQLEL